MIVRLDLASAASPATQIATQIAAGIDAGEVGPGAPLPTIRALAGDLGVAPGTVARAYAELDQFDRARETLDTLRLDTRAAGLTDRIASTSKFIDKTQAKFEKRKAKEAAKARQGEL